MKVAYDKYPKFDGKFGHLFYKTPFSHYRLRIEYRFVGDQCRGGPGWALRNSGVMIHGQPPESMRKDQEFPVSIEVQFLGGNGRNKRSTANVCTPGTNIVMGGKLITEHCTDSKAKTYHGDQWVTVEAEVHGNGVIKHIVNGETVIEYEKAQLDDQRGRRPPADQERRQNAQRRQHLTSGREPPDRVPQGGDPAVEGVTSCMPHRHWLWPRVTLTQLLVSIAILAFPMALYGTELREIPERRPYIVLLLGSLAAHCVEVEAFLWLIINPGIGRLLTRQRAPRPVPGLDDRDSTEEGISRALLLFGPCYAVVVPVAGWDVGCRGFLAPIFATHLPRLVSVELGLGPGLLRGHDRPKHQEIQAFLSICGVVRTTPSGHPLQLFLLDGCRCRMETTRKRDRPHSSRCGMREPP